MQMNDLPREASLEDLRRDTLAHYDEVSSKAVSWNSIVPRAINFYFNHRIEERDATPEPGVNGETIQEEAPEKRYFIVSYFYSEKSGGMGLGNGIVINTEDKFLNKEEFIQKSGYQNPIITSIQEISEKDYQDYSSKKEER